LFFDCREDVFYVFLACFDDEKWLKALFKMRKQLTFFALLFLMRFLLGGKTRAQIQYPSVDCFIAQINKTALEPWLGRVRGAHGMTCGFTPLPSGQLS
jgi:hypothetical protein